jgi:hypothetical protein
MSRSAMAISMCGLIDEAIQTDVWMYHFFCHCEEVVPAFFADPTKQFNFVIARRVFQRSLLTRRSNLSYTNKIKW